MALTKRVKYAFLKPKEASLTVQDEHRNPIPELCGYYSVKKHMRILLEAHDDVTTIAFDLLPSGFISQARDFAAHYRQKNLSWDEICNQPKNISTTIV